MALPPESTFKYSFVVPSGVTALPVRAEQEASSHRQEKMLYGLRPTLVLEKGAVRLWDGDRGSDDQCGLIRVDARLTSSLRGGDVLHVTGTCSCGTGLSVLREDELVVAAGAVSSVPLGNRVTLCTPSDLVEEAEAIFRRRYPDFQFAFPVIEVSIDGVSTLFGIGGGDIEGGGYHVRVYHPHLPGIPGTDECLGITRLDWCPKPAGILTARRLGNV